MRLAHEGDGHVLLRNSLPKDGGGQLIDVVDEGLSAVRGAEHRRAALRILSIPPVPSAAPDAPAAPSVEPGLVLTEN